MFILINANLRRWTIENKTSNNVGSLPRGNYYLKPEAKIVL